MVLEQEGALLGTTSASAGCGRAAGGLLERDDEPGGQGADYEPCKAGAFGDDSDLSTGYETPPIGSTPPSPPTPLDCDLSADGLDAPLLGKDPESVVYRCSTLVVLPAFAAYACLFSLQHEVKDAYGIADDASASSHSFSRSISSLFLFKLVFRFMHGIAFSGISARGRLFIGFMALGVSMLLLTIVTARLVEPLPVYVFVAYSLGGAGIGSFEANVQVAFTSLSLETKKYAVMGMPIGVMCITIGGFFMRYLGIPVYAIYTGSMVAMIAGAAILRYLIPDSPPHQGLRLPGAWSPPKRRCTLVLGLHSWRDWLPNIWTRAFCSLINNILLEIFAPALLLFVYNTPLLAVLGPPVWPNVVLVPKDLFFVIYNVCAGIGSFIGRYCAYRVRNLWHPAWSHIFHIVGSTLITLSLPGHALSPAALWLAPLGVFILLLADGFVYVMNSRFIDEHVPQPCLAAAFSSWLFTADVGSATGSNLVAYVRDWVSV